MSRTATVTSTITLSRTYGDGRIVDWRLSPPVLAGDEVVLREVQPSDADSLAALLTTPEITRFISEPPSTAEGFSRFIAASHRVRAAGQGICFAVTLRGCETAIGIVQVRRLSQEGSPRLSAESDVAEWGFAIGSPFWGAGVFTQAAALVLPFVFEQMQVRRVEARAAVRNERAAAVLRKVGARPERLLRNGLFRAGEYLDQTLWTIDGSDWQMELPAARYAAVVH